MTDERMRHPSLRLEEPFANDADAKIRAAIGASETGSIRLYQFQEWSGQWDTDESADIVTLRDGELAVLDEGTDT